MADSSLQIISSSSEVSSSNKDPLEWNQKKRTMILNLGLTEHSETGETPTPTRFIRNCEEVGLFQDLQHVNPFDEEFKKAIENSASINLQVPAEISDDSLHTPQICPHLEGNSDKPNLDVFHSIESHPMTNIMVSSVSTLDDDADDDCDDDGYNSLVIVEADSSNDNEIYERPSQSVRRLPKETLAKAVIQKNTKIKKRFQQTSTGIKLVPIEKLLNNKQSDKRMRRNGSVVTDLQKQRQQKGATTATAGQRSSEAANNKKITSVMTGIERQREANKAAQIRCRKRKQQDFEEMKLENKRLKSENAKLVIVNCNLEKQIQKLQDIIKEGGLGKDISVNPASSNIGRVEEEHLTLNERISTMSENQIIPNGTSSAIPSINRPSDLSTLKKRTRFKSSAVKVRKPVAPPPIVPKLVLPLPLPVNAENATISSLQNNLNTIVVLYPRPIDPVVSSVNSLFHNIFPK